MSAHAWEELNRRMLQWYGPEDAEGVDDYQLWATARLILLDNDPNRPMRPEDLDSSVRLQWQERLDQCATLEDAETVVSRVRAAGLSIESTYTN
jgi:hypothetical protein